MRVVMLGGMFLILGTLQTLGQVSVWDIGLLEAQIAHNKAEYKKQTALRDGQMVSSATQIKAKDAGKKFEEKVKVIHSRLTSLSGLLSDGKMAYEAASVIKDILKYQAEILDLISDDPTLFPLSMGVQAHLIDRSTMLGKYVTLMVIAAGDLNAMKTSDRRQILKHIVDELRIIRGDAYGLVESLNWAKQGSLFNLLNPWSHYVNQDRRLGKDILDQLKF